MKFLSLLLTVSLFFSFAAQAQWNLFTPEKKTMLKCENLRDIKKGFLIAHINTSKLTPTLESRTIKRHIEALDPMRVYFSQEDVNTLTAKM